MHQQGLARPQPSAVENISPDGEGHFRQGGGINQVHAGGPRKALPGGHRGVLSVATASQQRTHRGAYPPLNYGRPHCSDNPGHLKPQQI